MGNTSQIYPVPANNSSLMTDDRVETPFTTYDIVASVENQEFLNALAKKGAKASYEEGKPITTGQHEHFQFSSDIFGAKKNMNGRETTVQKKVENTTLYNFPNSLTVNKIHVSSVTTRGGRVDVSTMHHDIDCNPKKEGSYSRSDYNDHLCKCIGPHSISANTYTYGVMSIDFQYIDPESNFATHGVILLTSSPSEMKTDTGLKNGLALKWDDPSTASQIPLTASEMILDIRKSLGLDNSNIGLLINESDL